MDYGSYFNDYTVHQLWACFAYNGKNDFIYPIFGSVFQSKSIMTVIYEELEDKGYEIESMGTTYDSQKRLLLVLKVRIIIKK
ncbi:hypothetical protein A499_23367 [Niallia nealsonii AAU1]|nr:hypothetical protein A499_23367 [Niallia nealsonii AAU1]